MEWLFKEKEKNMKPKDMVIMNMALMQKQKVSVEDIKLKEGSW